MKTEPTLIKFDDTPCNCFLCTDAIANITNNPPPPVAHNRTPWAVHCRAHGLVHLTSHEYRRQLCRPDDLWECPICEEPAYWSDDEYEKYLEEAETREGDSKPF